MRGCTQSLELAFEQLLHGLSPLLQVESLADASGRLATAQDLGGEVGG